LYGNSIADDFGPSQLRTVRDAMIGFGWVRRSINLHLSRLKHLFRWAGEHGLVRPEVYHGLLCVSGLRGGRSDAKESEPVKPVPQAFIDAALPHVLPPVRAMTQVQLLTGCRPGEVCIMRGIDLDMTGRVWVYRPESHKTQHHGHQREIFIGPKCQEVVRPFLKLDVNAYLFSPADAEQARIEALRRNRKSPLWPSHVKAQEKKRKRHPKRIKGDHYTVGSYRAAIGRACRRANRQAHQEQPEIAADQVVIPSWHPHQLRHNSGTLLRREFGLEMARIVLGHSSPFVTQIYAEKDRELAMDALSKIG
jgi:integrase